MAASPPRATLLYDDGCAFCTRAATFVAERLDRDGLVSLAPIRSAAGEALLGDLPDSLRDGSWHLVAADGRRWSAGAAVAPLLRLLPALAWLAPAAEALPGPVEAAYRLVAGQRGGLSRLGGGGGRCGPAGGRSTHT